MAECRFTYMHMHTHVHTYTDIHRYIHIHTHVTQALSAPLLHVIVMRSICICPFSFLPPRSHFLHFFSLSLRPPELIPLQIHIFHCHASGFEGGSERKRCFTDHLQHLHLRPHVFICFCVVYCKHNASITLTQEIFQSVSVSEMNESILLSVSAICPTPRLRVGHRVTTASLSPGLRGSWDAGLSMLKPDDSVPGAQR